MGPRHQGMTWVRIPGCPTKKLRARTNEDKGRTGKEGQGQDGQGRSRAGWARKDKGRTWTRKGKDMLWARLAKTGQWQGQFTGRTDKGLRWAGRKIAGCQLIRVSPGLDARTKMAQHSLRQSYPDTLDYKWHSLGKQNILPANLDYKWVWLQDSPGMRAKLSTVMAHPGCQTKQWDSWAGLRYNMGKL